jgi:hypothetical protein
VQRFCTSLIPLVRVAFVVTETNRKSMRPKSIVIISLVVLLTAGSGFYLVVRPQDESRPPELNNRQSSPVKSNTDSSSEPVAPEIEKIFPILSDFESTLKVEGLEWATSVFLTSTKFAQYERVRLVNIDFHGLLRRVRQSQQYLSSAGTNLSGDPRTTIDMSPFENLNYQLLIQNAQVNEVNGIFIITLSGPALKNDGRVGSWNMSIDEVSEEISGLIDAADGWTTFGPGPDRAFHVFRSMSQVARQEQQQGKDY